jgi:hypothetical protein
MDENTDNNDNYESLNQEILKKIQISSQEHMLIKSLEKFYVNNVNMKKMLPIINGESMISMRLIDFFVTLYSKQNRVTYNLVENNNKVLFNVYLSYKSQLKAYNKKYFDPFSRGNRIPFFFPDDCIITTIGQLNFFKWFISKNVLDYVQKNLAEIELALNKSKSANKKNVKKKGKKPKNINKNNYNKNNNFMTYNKELKLNDKKELVDIIVTFE